MLYYIINIIYENKFFFCILIVCFYNKIDLINKLGN